MVEQANKKLKEAYEELNAGVNEANENNYLLLVSKNKLMEKLTAYIIMLQAKEIVWVKESSAMENIVECLKEEVKETNLKKTNLIVELEGMKETNRRLEVDVVYLMEANNNLNSDAREANEKYVNVKRVNDK